MDFANSSKYLLATHATARAGVGARGISATVDGTQARTRRQKRASCVLLSARVVPGIETVHGAEGDVIDLEGADGAEDDRFDAELLSANFEKANLLCTRLALNQRGCDG